MIRRLVRRWWFWLGAAGLAAVVLAGVIATSTPSDSTADAFRKVMVGMTKDEVDQLVGEFNGPDNSVNRLGARWTDESGDEHWSVRYRAPTGRCWADPTECLFVDFDCGPMNRTKAKQVLILNNPQDARTLWERIRDEYRYQKRRLGW